MIPKWTNVLVSALHHWPLSVSGPKSAPQRTACAVEGSVHETPLSPMATYTSTFVAIKVSVATGVNLTRAASAAAAVILRQSLHSVATLEPKEKLLNSWPHLGQFGIWKFSLSATGDLPRIN